MTSHRWLTWVALLLVVVNAALSAQARPQIASLGECVLSSGARLPDCRLGYRVLGARAAREDNVVLVPTWLGGTSADWVSLLGPGRLIDTTRYQVMVVDALGDGVSSSPSNQNVRPFPAITIEDMVATQYRLATEVLGLKRLHAVVGVSMGGIQVFDLFSRMFPLFGM